MKQDLLSKYTGRSVNDRLADLTSSDVEAAEDDFGSFGWLRGIRGRAICLELRKRTSDIVAIPYSWLERFEFTSADLITLYTRGNTIRINGRGLNAEIRPGVRLFEGITRGKVTWILEADKMANLNVDRSQIIIEVIEW